TETRSEAESPEGQSACTWVVSPVRSQMSRLRSAALEMTVPTDMNRNPLCSLWLTKKMPLRILRFGGIVCADSIGTKSLNGDSVQGCRVTINEGRTTNYNAETQGHS
ncbi:MAG: hypothetical protein ACYTEK_11590, partial [Planctomycetota bacterium]